MKINSSLQRLISAAALLFVVASVQAQNCTSTVTMNLKSTQGGYHSGQTVTLTSFSDSKKYTVKSDTQGNAIFELPCDQQFDVNISNYPYEGRLKTSSQANSKATKNYQYPPNLVENQKKFAMDENEKKAVNAAIAKLPDTTRIRRSNMQEPKDLQNYAVYDILLKDLKRGPLVGEKVTFSGTDRDKSFQGKTDSKGRLHLYLPKGDVYKLNFQYHKNYKVQEVKFMKGKTTARLEIQYMGTEEYLRRKEAEKKRAEEEKKRVAAALLRNDNEFIADKIVETVMNRNNWEDKLIICDVSSEMMPYAKKLAVWYGKNEATEQSTQFAFYYNGMIRDGGNSTGVYHQTSQGYDSLMALIKRVHDYRLGRNADYDIEALIKSEGVQNDYKDVLLIVDKDRTLADYEYFMQLEIPVHIVLCVDPRRVNPQHLEVAWKTKGSFHTMREDITDIGKYVEGDTVTVEGVKYQIMGGKFVRL